MTESELGAEPGAAQAVLRLLGRVDRRLRFNRNVSSALLFAALVLVAIAAWRLAARLHDALPVAAALVALLAILAGAGLALLLVYGVASARGGLARAAAQTDRSAALRDEMRSALHFLRGPRGLWTAAQVERAAARTRSLEPGQIAPLRIPAHATASLLIAVGLLGVAWRFPPIARPPQQVHHSAQIGLTAEEQQQVQALQALVADASVTPATRALRQALDTLQRADAADEDKQRALAQAQEAAEQNKLEVASAREGLYRLGKRLQQQAGMEEVAQALAEGDARKAAELLERKSALAGDRALGRPDGDDGSGRSGGKDLDKLLQDAAQAGGQGADQAGASSAAMKEAVDRLKQIASELDVQGTVGNSAKLLQQLQLAVAQRSTLSAGRFAQQAAQDSSPGSESGDTVMPGGRMFRSGAVAQESERSEQQEGSKSGDAQGESVADPLLGARARPLEVQLKQEALPQRDEPDENTGESWFYAESKEQKSALEARAVQARAAFAQAESTPPTGVAVRHRHTVREYFMNLREGAQ